MPVFSLANVQMERTGNVVSVQVKDITSENFDAIYDGICAKMKWDAAVVETREAWVYFVEKKKEKINADTK